MMSTTAPPAAAIASASRAGQFGWVTAPGRCGNPNGRRRREDMAGAAVVAFLLALLLTDGSLFAAFAALALVAGIGWVAHRLLR